MVDTTAVVYDPRFVPLVIWGQSVLNEYSESGSFLASRMLRQASLSPAIRGKDSSIKMVSAMLEEQINDTEQCPACGKVIEFTEISLGKCEDGHYWSEQLTHSKLEKKSDILQSLTQVVALLHPTYYRHLMSRVASVVEAK